MATNGRNGRLNAKQRAAIALLVGGESNAAAAAAVRCSERQFYRWLQDRDFDRELRAAQRDVLGQAINKLRTAATLAGDVLTATMKDKAATPAARTRAADIVLARLPSLSEYAELEARVDALESQILQGGGK